MATSTADIAKALEPLTGSWFESGKTRLPELYKEVFRVEGMSRTYVEDALLVGTGLLNETSEGESVTYDSIRQGFVKRYTPTQYQGGVIITKNAIADGMDLDLVKRQSQFLGRSAMETKNVVAFNVLNRAFNSSYTGGDAKSLCASDHPTAYGTMTNTFAVDLSEAALETMDKALGDIRDDRGLRLNIKPKKLILPRGLKYDAHRILRSDKRVGSVENDTNAIRDMDLFPGGSLIVDYLTDTDAFFILTDEDEQGLKMLMRQDAQMASDGDFDNGNIKFKVEMRFAVGWTNWRHVMGSAGA